MPYLSEVDISDIRFAARESFDFIAASFVTCPDDVLAIRKILEEEGRGDIRIISKIENGEGVKNIDDILRVSDGIMVARGDMGVEIPFEEIPQIQKMLIKKGYNANKQVITATQMLKARKHERHHAVGRDRRRSAPRGGCKDHGAYRGDHRKGDRL